MGRFYFLSNHPEYSDRTAKYCDSDLLDSISGVLDTIFRPELYHLRNSPGTDDYAVLLCTQNDWNDAEQFEEVLTDHQIVKLKGDAATSINLRLTMEKLIYMCGDNDNVVMNNPHLPVNTPLHQDATTSSKTTWFSTDEMWVSSVGNSFPRMQGNLRLTGIKWASSETAEEAFIPHLKTGVFCSFLRINIASHGLPGSFILNDGVVKYSWLDELLDKLPCRNTVIIDSCYSGNARDFLAQRGREVYTDCGADELSTGEYDRRFAEGLGSAEADVDGDVAWRGWKTS